PRPHDRRRQHRRLELHVLLPEPPAHVLDHRVQLDPEFAYHRDPSLGVVTPRGAGTRTRFQTNRSARLQSVGSVGTSNSENSRMIVLDCGSESITAAAFGPDGR